MTNNISAQGQLAAAKSVAMAIDGLVSNGYQAFMENDSLNYKVTIRFIKPGGKEGADADVRTLTVPWSLLLTVLEGDSKGMEEYTRLVGSCTASVSKLNQFIQEKVTKYLEELNNVTRKDNSGKAQVGT